jgi:hypothetical protein
MSGCDSVMLLQASTFAWHDSRSECFPKLKGYRLCRATDAGSHEPSLLAQRLKGWGNRPALISFCAV